MAAFIVGLMALSAVGAFIVALLSNSLSNPGPVAPNASVLAPSSTNAQNSVWAYMASHGYRGDAIGHPILEGGGNDPGMVVILMPIQSPDFRIGQSVLTDPDTQKQISMAFTSMSNFYPSMDRFGVGLEYGAYILLYSVTASDVLDVTQGRMSVEAFWSRVESQTTLLDALTWSPVYDKSFLSKDFTSSHKLARILPPNAEPASRGRGQIIAQPSTAYLPAGQDLILVGTAISSTGIAVTGQDMEFSYTSDGNEPKLYATQSTDASGSSRSRFTLPEGLGDTTILSVSGRGVATSALAPVTLGPLPAEAESEGIITGSLALQGYNVLSVGHDAATGEASALAEMVVPRFDRRARGQVLTIAGTLFTVFSSIQTARPILLYRYAGNTYELAFHIQRTDWQSWLDGTTSEADLWEEIKLAEIIDAQSGRLVSERDFFSKDFVGTTDRTDVTSRKYVEGSLTTEPDVEQLNPGHFKVPVGGFVLSFTREELTAGAAFAIYNVVDPIDPVYDSAKDPNGDILQGLQLSNGQYLVSITTGAAPAMVRLAYSEHLLSSSSSTP